MQLTELDRPSMEDRRERLVSTTAPRTEWGGLVAPDETADDIKELRMLRRMRI